MSTAPLLYAQVYVHHAESKSYEHIGLNMDRAKLEAFSLMARQELANGGNIHPRLPFGGRHCIVFEARMIDIPSARAICKWIEDNDVDHPVPLARHHAASDTLPDLVKLYHAGYRFYLQRDLRGRCIHDDLVWYIKAAPLRWDEFVMIMEYCGFDTSVCNLMMNDVMYHRVKGLLKDAALRYPDEAKIEEWARAAGHWPYMMEIEYKIRDNFKQRDAFGIW